MAVSSAARKSIPSAGETSPFASAPKSPRYHPACPHLGQHESGYGSSTEGCGRPYGRVLGGNLRKKRYFDQTQPGTELCIYTATLWLSLQSVLPLGYLSRALSPNFFTEPVDNIPSPSPGKIPCSRNRPFPTIMIIAFNLRTIAKFLRDEVEAEAEQDRVHTDAIVRRRNRIWDNMYTKTTARDSILDIAEQGELESPLRSEETQLSDTAVRHPPPHTGQSNAPTTGRVGQVMSKGTDQHSHSWNATISGTRNDETLPRILRRVSLSSSSEINPFTGSTENLNFLDNTGVALETESRFPPRTIDFPSVLGPSRNAAQVAGSGISARNCNPCTRAGCVAPLDHVHKRLSRTISPRLWRELRRVRREQLRPRPS